MELVALVVLVVAVSLGAGLLPQALAGRVTPRGLSDLTGLASGLLLASAFLVVVPEGFHLAADGNGRFDLDPVVLGLAVLAGFGLLLVLEGLGFGPAVHEEHHDHKDGHGHEHVHHPGSGGLAAIGLSIHALADGLAIGAAAASGEASFSLLVAFAVVVHRIPAALSLGVFLLHQPGGRRAAVRGLLWFTVATPAALVVWGRGPDGADESILALVLLFSAGTFVYVATVDTLPAIHNPETGRRSVRNVAASAAALALVLLVLNGAGVLDHGHGPDHDHEPGHSVEDHDHEPGHSVEDHDH